jgi:hypothetical protein
MIGDSIQLNYQKVSCRNEQPGVITPNHAEDSGKSPTDEKNSASREVNEGIQA